MANINPTKVFIIITMIIIFIIPFLLDWLVFGNSIKSNLTNSEWSNFLGGYIGGIVGGLATLVAVVISLNISKKIQNESELKENGLIVFYDLMLGLTDLKKLYINYKYPNYKDIPSRMNFSKEWIKNISRISGPIRDTDKLYKLYGYLEMLSEEVKNKNDLQMLVDMDPNNQPTLNNFNNRFNKTIEKVVQKVFSNELLNFETNRYSNNDDIELDIENDLNEEYKIIILRLSTIISRI